MAVISSHTLNGVDGSHAGGIGVALRNLSTGETLFDTATDPGGRLSQEIPAGRIDPAACYEMVFATGAWWAGRVPASHGARIMAAVALRFSMPDPGGRYHMPLIVSPNACSFWCSTEKG